MNDSLAADSIRAGGDFSSGNPSGILDTKADSSTLAQGGDTAGAHVLEPTTSAAAVDDARASERAFSNDNEDTYAGKGSTGASSADFKTTDTSSTATDSGAQKVPRYTEGSTGEHRKGEYDTTDGPTTVGDLGEIGSKTDPGRVALQDIQKQSARVGGAIGTGKEGDNENPYDALDPERST